MVEILISLLYRAMRCDDRNVETTLVRVCKLLRQHQLLLSLHSLGNRDSIFAHKFVCISLAIMGFFFFIRLVHFIPIVSVMFLIIGANSVAFYSIIWDGSSEIPATTGTLRVAADAVSKRCASHELRAFYSRQVASIPLLSVRVGKFGCMEQNSTLSFMDFVLSNLASLLISF